MLLQIAPYFGYLASLLLIIALLVNNDLKFRWFNTMGNVSFIAYAIIFNAYPVLLTNCILLCINVYYLLKVYNKKENFDLFEFEGKEKMVQKFTEYYRQDITGYFPEFNASLFHGQLNFAVTRDLVIANIFSASLKDNGDAEVIINYTTQKYRDYKVGTFIFEKEHDYLVSKGVKRIVYKHVANKKHLRFLEVMGFVYEDGLLIKKI
ncbi:YgjV family protein [Ferruginibacter sp. HRS2-29]|uniref:YgjV family protein n=1 Tax=Ferruginibacter sp. HRS2-29 TaxID=2487334 RepID=UPI0020CDE11A|nr:YgjV family protein [Ferruginibacter sp. HRS2-29]MCP9752768.1 hypothetical protein [Ferruginibacter sp. HRS2-29]